MRLSSVHSRRPACHLRPHSATCSAVHSCPAVAIFLLLSCVSPPNPPPVGTGEYIFKNLFWSCLQPSFLPELLKVSIRDDVFIFSQDHDRVLAFLLFVVILLFFFCLGFAQRGLQFEANSIMRASSQTRSSSFVLWHQRKLTGRPRSLICLHSYSVVLCPLFSFSESNTGRSFLAW